MKNLLILLILLTSLPARADSPVIWFGLWAKSLTTNGLQARGLKLDKNATPSTPSVLLLPSPSLVTTWSLTLPIDDGTANYVLITDGAGVTSWAAAETVTAGTPNTFAGFNNTGAFGSIPGWLWTNATGGAAVDLNPIPVTGEGYKNLNTFYSTLNPASNVTGSSWIAQQVEMNVGNDDSGNSFSADNSGQVIGQQINLNSRNKSSVGGVYGVQQNTQIGNGTDAITGAGYTGFTSNFQVKDNATITNQSYNYAGNLNIEAAGTLDSYSGVNLNANSLGTITSFNGTNIGGNFATVTNNASGHNASFIFGNVGDYTGFNSVGSVTGTVTNSYKGFTASGTVATSNGTTIFADFMQVTNNATNGYFSFSAVPNITTTTSYTALNASPNIGTVSNYVNMIDTAGTASVTVPYWTDLNIHPNLPLVTEGYKGLNLTPVAAGDGSGFATVAYLDASQLTNFSTGQILALQTQGDAQINGKLNAFSSVTPIDQGGNPNAVHGIISAINTTPNATTANVDTIGVNTASLITVTTNSINTSGPFGLGLTALALPAVLKTETGSSIDHVSGGTFAISLDATSTGGTVDELIGGRFTVIPQGGTHTISTLKLVKADLPFGDPAVRSWGFYGSSTSSENWFAKNIKIGGTAGSTDFVSDASSVLQVEGGSIDVLNGQLKTSTTGGGIYITPDFGGTIAAQIPDSTTTGGNPRGTFTVDLQTFRNNADEVASANVAVVIGAGNKASGEFSMALGGAANYATAEKSVTLGGADNTAEHQGAYVFGSGGKSQTVSDFIFAGGGGGGSSEANNFFRIAGDTHSLHVGVYDPTGQDGLENALILHSSGTGNQAEYMGFKAPASVTTPVILTLPNGDGTSGQLLSTNGAGVLGWSPPVSAPSTAGGVYSDGSAFQSVAFAANANKVFGVNSAATSMEAKSIGVGTTGTDFAVAHSAGAITLNLPDAGASARGAVTTGSQTFAGVKSFSSEARFTDGSSGTPGMTFSSDPDTGIYRPGGNSLNFATAGTKAGGISSDGEWTFGKTTGPGLFHTFESGDRTVVVISSRSSNSAQIQYKTNNTVTAYQTVDSGGNLTFAGALGDALFTVGATGIANFGNPNLPTDGPHDFINKSTTQRTAQFRNLNVTTSSDSRANLLLVKGSTTDTTSQIFQQFQINDGGTNSGQINANGASQAAFGTFSDARLKTNIEDLPAQLDNILALRPVEFDYIKGGHQLGFIAQDMLKVYPDVVAEDPDTKMLMVSGWDKTTARLVKAIQELHEKNESLEKRLAALESRLSH